MELQIALFLIVVLAVVAWVAAYRYAPPNTLTRWTNYVSFGAIATGEVLQYLAGFPWREVMPIEYAPFVILALNVLNIMARNRKAAGG